MFCGQTWHSCPGEPTPPSCLQVRRAVLDGNRPEIPPRDSLPGPDNDKFMQLDAYCQLLRCAELVWRKWAAFACVHVFELLPNLLIGRAAVAWLAETVGRTTPQTAPLLPTLSPASAP